MASMVLSRLVQAVPSLLGVTIIAFAPLHLSGDITQLLLPMEASEEVRAGFRCGYGLDAPAYPGPVRSLPGAVRVQGDVRVNMTTAAHRPADPPTCPRLRARRSNIYLGASTMASSRDEGCSCPMTEHPILITGGTGKVGGRPRPTSKRRVSRCAWSRAGDPRFRLDRSEHVGYRAGPREEGLHRAAGRRTADVAVRPAREGTGGRARRAAVGPRRRVPDTPRRTASRARRTSMARTPCATPVWSGRSCGPRGSRRTSVRASSTTRCSPGASPARGRRRGEFR